MSSKKNILQPGYFKQLGQKYYLEGIKLMTGHSNRELAKLIKVSPTTVGKILNQNTRNLANFRISTFKKITKTINNIDKKKQFKLAYITKELKKSNNRISKKRKEQILKNAEKELQKALKKDSINSLMQDDKKGYLYFRVLYGYLNQ